MADVEERAERWVEHNMHSILWEIQDGRIKQALIDAYLAGAAQAASDYSQHYNRPGAL